MPPANQTTTTAFELIAPEYAVVVYEGILLQLWRTATTADGVRLVRKTLKDFAQQIRFTVVVIEDGATTPGSEARAELQALAAELVPRFAAVVYEGDGFRAAAVRAVITSILLFTRQALPVKIFSSTASATEWARKAHPEIPGIHTVGEFLSQFRAPLCGSPAPAAAALRERAGSKERPFGAAG